MALREDTHPMVSDPKQRPLGFQGYILQHNKCAYPKPTRGIVSTGRWFLVDPLGDQHTRNGQRLSTIYFDWAIFSIANCNKFYQRLFRGNHVESCLIFVQAQISRKTRLHESKDGLMGCLGMVLEPILRHQISDSCEWKIPHGENALKSP